MRASLRTLIALGLLLSQQRHLLHAFPASAAGGSRTNSISFWQSRGNALGPFDWSPLTAVATTTTHAPLLSAPPSPFRKQLPTFWAIDQLAEQLQPRAPKLLAAPSSVHTLARNINSELAEQAYRATGNAALDLNASADSDYYDTHFDWARFFAAGTEPSADEVYQTKRERVVANDVQLQVPQRDGNGDSDS